MQDTKDEGAILLQDIQNAIGRAALPDGHQKETRMRVLAEPHGSHPVRTRSDKSGSVVQIAIRTTDTDLSECEV